MILKSCPASTPSIIPGTIPESEESFTQFGLNTVQAVNKPSLVACVNTVNFLADPEPEPESEAPLPTQLSLPTRKIPKRKKRSSGNVDKQKPSSIVEVGDKNDDGSVMSAPTLMMGGSRSRPSTPRRLPFQTHMSMYRPMNLGEQHKGSGRRGYCVGSRFRVCNLEPDLLWW